MKSKVCFAVFILCGIMSDACRGEDRAGFVELYKAGQAHQAAGRHAEARSTFEVALRRAAAGVEKAEAHIAIGLTYDAERDCTTARAAYEKALTIEGITAEQTGRVWLHVASGHMNEFRWQAANVALEKVIAMEGASTASKVQAHLLVARIFSNYGGQWGWGRVKAACARVLETPSVPAAQKLAAQTAMVKALLGLKQYTDARRVMNDIVAAGDLSRKERAATQILIGKTRLLERDFAEARAELVKALAMEGISDADKADIQLHLALSYYDAQDYQRAKPELLKVLAMPGAGARCMKPGRDNAYSPSREATLRLRLRKMIPAEEPSLTVLFIGSSMTMRGDMPFLLAALAASAPAGRPRIIPGLFARGGTKIDVFWNEGDTPDTARGTIAAEPWDAVVIETFYTMSRDDLFKYGTLFGNLIRSRNAQAVLYAAPAARAQPYPDAFRKFQDEVVALGRTQGMAVAPAVGAYLHFLGPAPTPAQFDTLYADWIHATEKGNYLIACCLYAALTGFSPMGLAHPGMSEAEAKALQEAAWRAFQDSRSSK